MSATLEDIAARALKLSREERFELVSRLLGDEEDSDSTAIEALGKKSIEAIDNGSAVGVPYDQVPSDNRRAK